MPVFAMTNVEILVDGFAATGYANQLAIDVTADELDVTTFASGGWRQKKVGLATSTASIKGFQDYASNGPDPTFTIATFGATDTITVAPTGGSAVGDPVFFSSGVLKDMTPLTGAVGDMATFSLGWAGTGQMVRGSRLHPLAARTATGNSTALAFTAPTATQTLYAAWHVTSVTGTGTITFTVQTDDNVGFTTPTTRITSPAIAAVGGGIGSLAGALTGETHIRVAYTVVGFTSVTFAVSAGVL